MKKITMLLLMAIGLTIGVGPGVAEAAHKKKAAVIKKHRYAKKHFHARKYFHSKKRFRRTALQETTRLALKSSAALVMDEATGAVLFAKNPGAVLPIASISKLMTAMVMLDAKPDMNQVLTITGDDVDKIRHSRSRLLVGTRLTREDMLHLALMSSENRAAYALSSNYPGGRPAFVAAMNRKAQELGLTQTHFDDPTGLTATDVSSPRDLVKMVIAAQKYPLIHKFTTSTEYEVSVLGHPTIFHNTNSLVRNSSWDIGLSKTGFINEAGKCLVMQARLNKKPMIIVLLDSYGRMTRVGDAIRIRRWVESASVAQRLAAG